MDRLSIVGCKDFLSADTLESSSLTGVCLFITKSSSYDAPLFALLCIIYFLFNRLVLGSFLLDFLYGTKYTSLREVDKHVFRLRHVGIFARSSSFILISKPAFMVAFANKQWFEPYSQGSDSTLGDIAFVSVITTAAFHLFELISNQSLKPLLVLHHLGSIFVIQWFVPAAISLPKTQYLELSQSLGMMNIALYWAFLDAPLVVLSYVIAVLRSTLVHEHNIRKLFYVGLNIALFITTLEIVVIAYLSLQNWTLLSGFQRAMICLLQTLFTVSKAWVCRSFYLSYTRQLQPSESQAFKDMSAVKPE